MVQGVIAGTGTLFTYAKMVTRLGPALAPGLAASLAGPVLKHVRTEREITGLAVAMAGLLVAVKAAAPSTR